MARYEPMLPLITTALGKGKSQRGFSPDTIAPMVAPVYDDILEYCLKEHYWSFAEALPTTLQEVGGQKPPLNYSKLYHLPSDFVSVTYMNGTGEQLVGWKYGWNRFGKYLAANFKVYLSYTRKAFEYEEFDAHFKYYLSLTVAARICLVATGDKDLKDSLLAERKMIQPEIINIDMRDQGDLEQVTIDNVSGARIQGAIDFGLPRNIGPFEDGPLNRE